MVTVIFETKRGAVETNDRFPGIYGYFPIEPDGLSDDCIYYFKIIDNRVVPCGWNYGRYWEPQYIKENSPWTTDYDPEGTEFHDEQYEKELLENLVNNVFVLTY